MSNTLNRIFDYAESDPSQKIYTFLSNYNFRFKDKAINKIRRTDAKGAFRRSLILALDCKISPAIKNDPQALENLKTLLDQPFMRRKDLRDPVYWALFCVLRDMRCPITEKDNKYYIIDNNKYYYDLVHSESYKIVGKLLQDTKKAVEVEFAKK